MCGFDDQYQTCVKGHPNEICEVSGVMYTDNVTLAGVSTVVAFGNINYEKNTHFGYGFMLYSLIQILCYFFCTGIQYFNLVISLIRSMALWAFHIKP